MGSCLTIACSGAIDAGPDEVGGAGVPGIAGVAGAVQAHRAQRVVLRVLVGVHQEEAPRAARPPRAAAPLPPAARRAAVVPVLAATRQ